ncbi:helix-turn-helix domain-containing protein [Corallococcus macrosporus]|uniref:TPR repeat-containing protein n=1 Tax=Myxococcus fulvus (strain ATCC BAA-855 / HW-1) TaxID=483219 RepID=F8CHE8_MYXFH|nr:helix-turn-helix domain-containing protein [Corallococcus macrosporus]AEI66266.1 TPR repeat-containing protein [Corallococcus macrosporus]
MSYFNLPSGSGIEYPRSGRLLGEAAEFLRLKGFLRNAEDFSYKTAQRVFDDDVAVAREKFDAVLKTLVEAMFPEALVPRDVLPATEFEPAAWALAVTREAAERWDELAALMNSLSFPITEKRDAPIPFLRLYTLDAGIRWGAYQVLRIEYGHSPTFRPVWLEHDVFRRVMNKLGEKRATVAELAKMARVSRNTMDSWRTGKSEPSNENLSFLADALAAKAGVPAEELNARLRLAAGAAACRSRLAGLIGEERLTDFIKAFETTARLTSDVLLTVDLGRAERRSKLLDIIHRGAHSQPGRMLCDRLAEKARFRQEVMNDLLALPGPWHSRLNAWAQQLGPMPFAGEPIAKELKIPAKKAHQMMPFVREMLLRMSGYDSQVEFEGAQVVTLSGPPEFKARNRASQAGDAFSRGDLRSAIEHMRIAVQWAPSDAGHHYMLGAYLGHAVSSERHQLLTEAIHHCAEAARLAPEWDRPPTEIGIILSNAGTYEEAEKAFASAEQVASKWDHFHFTRGVNHLFAKRFQAAIPCFRRALELDPKRVDAAANLVAALESTGLGESDEAVKLRRELDRKTSRWRELIRAPRPV